ncbi:putative pentatricopeptide repeat-containing protein At1g03510 [Rhodamnia argentea]|uniref:Pentatricopeptide repeat-containing protein At1g03510 n=1 Tax=Rhodamnia argentea TaxID=178133 RepID=A0A8B8QJ76_9MYRT|nr:putative pentatricopeptide repeat-containing protein At1g03510 [Rhodamnia argentea]
MHRSSSSSCLVSLTKVLTSYVSQGSHDQALALFRHMHSSLALSLDPFVFSSVLKSCAAISRPQLGASIHAHVVKSSIVSNHFVGCCLVNMYGKCVSVSAARHLFDEITERNAFVWNAMISLYSHSNRVDDALQLFEVMDVAPDVSTFNSIIAGLSLCSEGSSNAIRFHWRMRQLGLKPDLMTLLALLPACVDMAALSLIKEIQGYGIRNHIDPHHQLRSGLMEAYGRCGCLGYALAVFDGTKERDVVAWSSLISAYAINGEARTALEIFAEMEQASVQPDGIAFLGVLKACSHAGLADEALGYFARMQKLYGLEASSDHYSCLVDVLSRSGRLHDAYEILKDMPVKVTAKAWGALLGACRTYGEVELGEIAGKELSEVEPSNCANYVLLARIYSSMGMYEEAQRVRREMKEKGVKADSGSSWVV